MKDENSPLFIKETENRWKEYFSTLLIRDNDKEAIINMVNFCAMHRSVKKNKEIKANE